MPCEFCGYPKDSPVHDPLFAPEYCLAHFKEVVKKQREEIEKLKEVIEVKTGRLDDMQDQINWMEEEK